ncbi:MAG: amidohydrolase family protein, partial [Chloroflexi bacterium]|nr:amidohydrolase family protein [Chloroflexota bacterium]
MRGFVQTAIADILGPTNFRVDAQLAEAAKLLDEYRDKFDGRIHVSLGPAGDVTTSLKTMRYLAKVAESENLTVHMHVFPRWPTGIFSLLFRGRSPLGLLKAGGLLNQRLVAVHFLAAKDGDLKTLAKSGASIVHCPSVWMNAGIGPKNWLPIKKAYRAGVNIALGTDSFGGWIEGSDMFTEMRNCILVSSFLYGADSIKPTDVIRMATINGASALGLGKEIGSLEIGKQADLVLLKFDTPAVQLSTDIPAMLVYGSSGREVQTVLIDGRIVVRDRTLLTMNEHEVLEDASKARQELFRIGGWMFEHGKATPPTTSWLERYPNEKIAKWGKRLARLQKLFGN